MENEVEILAKVSSKNNNSRSSPRDGGVSKRVRSNRPRETEEEAIIRRFHDAQRMARFRARKKKALEDQQQKQQQQLQIKQLEANGITVRRNNGRDDSVSETESRAEKTGSLETESKYSQLLDIIERIGKDVRLSYAGSRSSAERLKSGIIRARSLVRDCLLDTRLNLRQ